MRNVLIFVSILLVVLLLRIKFLYQDASKYINGDKVEFTTTLFSQPTLRNGYQFFQVELPSKQLAFIYAPAYPQYHYGDTLKISGTFKENVLDNKKTIIVIQKPQITHQKNTNKFVNILSRIRKRITTVFHQVLSQNQASLLLGIVFGIKDSFSSDFFEKLKIAGVMHVIAASGMNVTLLSSVISATCIKFFNRKVSLIISILSILFYGLLSGFEPSIQRATIMGIMVSLAQVMGKQTLPLYLLFLAGYSMILFRPLVVYDIGFQLSFSATLGLMYIKPVIDRVSKKKIPFIMDDITTTIAAQLSTMPILFYYFQEYSPWSILSNALVLWTVPVLMVIGGIAAIFSFIFIPLSYLFLYLTIPLLSYFELIVSHVPAQVISITFISVPLIISYYLCMVIGIFRVKK